MDQSADLNAPTHFAPQDQLSGKALITSIDQHLEFIKQTAPPGAGLKQLATQVQMLTAVCLAQQREIDALKGRAHRATESEAPS